MALQRCDSDPSVHINVSQTSAPWSSFSEEAISQGSLVYIIPLILHQHHDESNALKRSYFRHIRQHQPDSVDHGPSTSCLLHVRFNNAYPSAGAPTSCQLQIRECRGPQHGLFVYLAARRYSELYRCVLGLHSQCLDEA